MRLLVNRRLKVDRGYRSSWACAGFKLLARLGYWAPLYPRVLPTGAGLCWSTARLRRYRDPIKMRRELRAGTVNEAPANLLIASSSIEPWPGTGRVPAELASLLRGRKEEKNGDCEKRDWKISS